jgi:hypothetical protein
VTANRWDDWVPQDRVRKFTDENKELAAQLHTQMKILQKQPKSASKGKGARTNGSDFSSARGSEERHASVAAQSSRGPRRNRDYDLEHVSSPSFLLYLDRMWLFWVLVVTYFAGAPARYSRIHIWTVEEKRAPGCYTLDFTFRLYIGWISALDQALQLYNIPPNT